MDPIFAEIPADLATLSDDEIQAAIDERTELAQRVADGDAEVIGERDATTVVDELTAGVEQIEALRAELAAREAARADAQAQIDALASRVLAPVADADGNPDADDDEGGSEDDSITVGDEQPSPDVETAPAAAPVAAPAEPQAVAASATRRAPARRVSLARARRAEPTPEADPERRTYITASSDIPGVPMGTDLPDLTAVGEALIRRRADIGFTAPGHVEKLRVATIHRRYDESEVLSPNDPEGNWTKIVSKVNPTNPLPTTSLVASGGLCAPLTPYYDLQTIATDDRPVRDSLARFNANRGGIQFAVPPTLADVTTGVGVMTAENDAIGGTTATKTCQHIECPELESVDVDMIYWCLQFGNLGSRAWPEQVAQFTQLTMAAHAREAETVLLDGIKAASTAVTATAELGAVASLLTEVLTAAAGMRSRHRMARNAVIRVMLPEWTLDLLVTDMWRSQFQRFDLNRNGLEALLRSQSVEPSFYKDTASGDGQVFGAQSAGALLNFPSTVVWYLFPEGSFLWLDGGTLDLGIVRDSVLNSTNDYSIFGETFEEVAFVGVESLHVTTTVCNDGTVSAPRTVTCPVL